MMPQMARHILESTAFAMIVALVPALMRKRGPPRVTPSG